jgi:nicotinamidase-related amidase
LAAAGSRPALLDLSDVVTAAAFYDAAPGAPGMRRAMQMSQNTGILHSMPAALLIIDVQRVLCSGEQAAYDVERVIDRINLVSRKARDAGALVVVIQHETHGGEMDFGSDGWQLAPALRIEAADVQLRKTATDSFHRTELHELLQSRGITSLVVCGLQSEFCVDTTTRRAMALGYPVVLVSDGHSTLDNGVLSAAQISAHHNKTLASIESFGPRVRAVPADDVHIER